MRSQVPEAVSSEELHAWLGASKHVARMGSLVLQPGKRGKKLDVGANVTGAAAAKANQTGAGERGKEGHGGGAVGFVEVACHDNNAARRLLERRYKKTIKVGDARRRLRRLSNNR